MNVVIITTNGYPDQFSADNSKAEFIALGLIQQGCKVTIIDTPYGSNGQKTTKSSISPAGIPYIQLPEKRNIINNNLKKYEEILLEKRIAGEENIVILGTFFITMFYQLSLISKKCGYKRSYVFHEWNIATKHTNLLALAEDYVFTYSLGLMVDSFLPISHYLEEKCKKFGKPQMILPVMATYERAKAKTILNHFTFCADALYILRNLLIIEAFQKVIISYPTTTLNLVLSGNQKNIEELKNLISEKKLENNITIKSKLQQEDLFQLYDTSIGLLIPLDPNSIPDKARFSQKIAEYIGSHRPIITNNVGEIPYYFEKDKSAVIVDYSIEGFAKGMMSLIENPSMADFIGENGFNIGKEYFDCIKNGKRIFDFFELD